MPAKKTALNYSKLLKISVKSYRFRWLYLCKTGKTSRKWNSYNSEVDTGDWLCYSITNKSSRESEGSEQNVHRKRTNVGSNVYEHAVLCSDAAWPTEYEITLNRLAWRCASLWIHCIFWSGELRASRFFAHLRGIRRNFLDRIVTYLEGVCERQANRSCGAGCFADDWQGRNFRYDRLFRCG